MCKIPLRVYMYPAGHAGVALYTYNLANSLSHAGIRVTLFSDDRYELGHLPADFIRQNVLSSRYEGIRDNKGYIARVAGIIRAHLYNSWKFYALVKKNRPEVVHLHSFFFYPVEWILVRRLKLLGVKTVLTVHTAVPYSFYMKFFPRLELRILQYIYGKVDKLIVHTEANKGQLLEHFTIENQKVCVIPHGEYSLEHLCPRTSERKARQFLGIHDTKKRVVLFFGYIRKIKGVDVLLRAFDEVANRFPDTILVIAGSLIEGQSFNVYREMIRHMKYGAQVRCFVRYIDHDEIPNFFVAADIVVLPYVEFFGQSGVLHLAQGFGKPVVVTDVGGLPEAVQNRHTGLIVRAGDSKQLADAMIELFDNTGLRDQLSEGARRMALKKFSWQAIGEATVKQAYS